MPRRRLWSATWEWALTRNGIASARKGPRFSDFAEAANAERHTPRVAVFEVVGFVLAMIIGIAILDYMMPASLGAAEQAAGITGQ